MSFANNNQMLDHHALACEQVSRFMSLTTDQVSPIAQNPGSYFYACNPFNENAQGVTGSPWQPILAPVKARTEYPEIIRRRMEASKSACSVGVFPEIHRIWICLDRSINDSSLDTAGHSPENNMNSRRVFDLILWDYEFSEDNSSPSTYIDEIGFQLYGSNGITVIPNLEEAVTAVGLVVPKGDRIHTEPDSESGAAIKYLLVFTTTSTIELRALEFSNNSIHGTILPYEIDLEFSLPTDGIVFSKVVGTAFGRIFLGGSDGCVHEVIMESDAPTGSGGLLRAISRGLYRGVLGTVGRFLRVPGLIGVKHRLRRQNIDISAIRLALSSFVGLSAPFNGYRIIDLVVDHDRDLLYSLALDGKISVYSLESPLVSARNRISSYYDSVSKFNESIDNIRAHNLSVPAPRQHPSSLGLSTSTTYQSGKTDGAPADVLPPFNPSSCTAIQFAGSLSDLDDKLSRLLSNAIQSEASAAGSASSGPFIPGIASTTLKELNKRFGFTVDATSGNLHSDILSSLGWPLTGLVVIPPGVFTPESSSMNFGFGGSAQFPNLMAVSRSGTRIFLSVSPSASILNQQGHTKPSSGYTFQINNNPVSNPSSFQLGAPPIGFGQTSSNAPLLPSGNLPQSTFSGAPSSSSGVISIVGFTPPPTLSAVESFQDKSLGCLEAASRDPQLLASISAHSPSLDFSIFVNSHDQRRDKLVIIGKNPLRLAGGVEAVAVLPTPAQVLAVGLTPSVIPATVSSKNPRFSSIVTSATMINATLTSAMSLTPCGALMLPGAETAPIPFRLIEIVAKSPLLTSSSLQATLETNELEDALSLAKSNVLRSSLEVSNGVQRSKRTRPAALVSQDFGGRAALSFFSGFSKVVDFVRGAETKATSTLASSTPSTVSDFDTLSYQNASKRRRAASYSSAELSTSDRKQIEAALAGFFVSKTGNASTSTLAGLESIRNNRLGSTGGLVSGTTGSLLGTRLPGGFTPTSSLRRPRTSVSTPGEQATPGASMDASLLSTMGSLVGHNSGSVQTSSLPPFIDVFLLDSAIPRSLHVEARHILATQVLGIHPSFSFANSYSSIASTGAGAGALGTNVDSLRSAPQKVFNVPVNSAYLGDGLNRIDNGAVADDRSRLPVQVIVVTPDAVVKLQTVSLPQQLLAILTTNSEIPTEKDVSEGYLPPELTKLTVGSEPEDLFEALVEVAMLASANSQKGSEEGNARTVSISAILGELALKEGMLSPLQLAQLLAAETLSSSSALPSQDTASAVSFNFNGFLSKQKLKFLSNKLESLASDIRLESACEKAILILRSTPSKPIWSPHAQDFSRNEVIFSHTVAAIFRYVSRTLAPFWGPGALFSTAGDALFVTNPEGEWMSLSKKLSALERLIPIVIKEIDKLRDQKFLEMCITRVGFTNHTQDTTGTVGAPGNMVTLADIQLMPPKQANKALAMLSDRARIMELLLVRALLQFISVVKEVCAVMVVLSHWKSFFSLYSNRVLPDQVRSDLCDLSLQAVCGQQAPLVGTLSTPTPALGGLYGASSSPHAPVSSSQSKLTSVVSGLLQFLGSRSSDSVPVAPLFTDSPHDFVFSVTSSQIQGGPKATQSRERAEEATHYLRQHAPSFVSPVDAALLLCISAAAATLPAPTPGAPAAAVPSQRSRLQSSDNLELVFEKACKSLAHRYNRLSLWSHVALIETLSALLFSRNRSDLALELLLIVAADAAGGVNRLSHIPADAEAAEQIEFHSKWNENALLDSNSHGAGVVAASATMATRVRMRAYHGVLSLLSDVLDNDADNIKLAQSTNPTTRSTEPTLAASQLSQLQRDLLDKVFRSSDILFHDVLFRFLLLSPYSVYNEDLSTQQPPNSRPKTSVREAAVLYLLSQPSDLVPSLQIFLETRLPPSKLDLLVSYYHFHGHSSRGARAMRQRVDADLKEPHSLSDGNEPAASNTIHLEERIRRMAAAIRMAKEALKNQSTASAVVKGSAKKMSVEQDVVSLEEIAEWNDYLLLLEAQSSIFSSVSILIENVKAENARNGSSSTPELANEVSEGTQAQIGVFSHLPPLADLEVVLNTLAYDILHFTELRQISQDLHLYDELINVLSLSSGVVISSSATIRRNSPKSVFAAELCDAFTALMDAVEEAARIQDYRIIPPTLWAVISTSRDLPPFIFDSKVSVTSYATLNSNGIVDDNESIDHVLARAAAIRAQLACGLALKALIERFQNRVVVSFNNSSNSPESANRLTLTSNLQNSLSATLSTTSRGLGLTLGTGIASVDHSQSWDALSKSIVTSPSIALADVVVDLELRRALGFSAEINLSRSYSTGSGLHEDNDDDLFYAPWMVHFNTTEGTKWNPLWLARNVISSLVSPAMRTEAYSASLSLIANSLLNQFGNSIDNVDSSIGYIGKSNVDVGSDSFSNTARLVKSSTQQTSVVASSLVFGTSILNLHPVHLRKAFVFLLLPWLYSVNELKNEMGVLPSIVLTEARKYVDVIALVIDACDEAWEKQFVVTSKDQLKFIVNN